MPWQKEDSADMMIETQESRCRSRMITSDLLSVRETMSSLTRLDTALKHQGRRNYCDNSLVLQIFQSNHLRSFQVNVLDCAWDDVSRFSQPWERAVCRDDQPAIEKIKEGMRKETSSSPSFSTSQLSFYPTISLPDSLLLLASITPLFPLLHPHLSHLFSPIQIWITNELQMHPDHRSLVANHQSLVSVTLKSISSWPTKYPVFITYNFTTVWI